MLWTGWSHCLYNWIFLFSSQWVGISLFLCATGVVTLQCCIIITMFSVLPSHLTLQMEIAVVEFPWHIEPKMSKCNPKWLNAAEYSSGDHDSMFFPAFLTAYFPARYHFSPIFFTSFINNPLVIWSHSQQKQLLAQAHKLSYQNTIEDFHIFINIKLKRIQLCENVKRHCSMLKLYKLVRN